MKEQERMQDHDLIFLVLVLLVEIARLKHDIIETDFRSCEVVEYVGNVKSAQH